MISRVQRAVFFLPSSPAFYFFLFGELNIKDIKTKKGNNKDSSNYITVALISGPVLFLPYLLTDFSRGRSGGLVFPSLSELSIVYCNPHSQSFGIVNKAEIDVFLELSCFFDDSADVGNLISGSSAFSKTSLNIWKFTVHVLLKPHLENFDHCFASV